MDQVLPALATSGPLALVLGVAVAVLWKKIQSQEAKIDAIQKANSDRLDAIAKAHEYRFDALQKGCEDKITKLNGELISTVRELAGAIRGDAP